MHNVYHSSELTYRIDLIGIFNTLHVIVEMALSVTLASINFVNANQNVFYVKLAIA